MHAEALPRGHAVSDEGLGRPLVFALGLHVLLVLVLWLSSWLTWNHDLSAAGNGTAIEATMDTSAAENRAVQRALRQQPEPLPQPVEEAAEEETTPPPQPVPEPRPQDAPTPQQVQAQERIPVPDTKDQDEARADAISQEKARQEQEAKRRQEQIDLTERKRVEEAENQRRLAAQQAETEKQAKLAEIRRQRAALEKQKNLMAQKLRQLADARATQASSAAEAAARADAGASAPAGQGGNDDGLRARYAAAIQEAVLRQWTRPESVALGTRCRVVITQIAGGSVIDAQVQPGCPMDQAGQDSIERAVLKAQPLPYRGFETVFSRTLNLNFVAQDR